MNIKLDLDIDADDFCTGIQRDIAAGNNHLQSIITERVIYGLARKLEKHVASGICIKYKLRCGNQGDIISLRSAVERGGFDFWYLTVQVDTQPGTYLSEVNVAEPTVMEWLPIGYGGGIKRGIRVRHKTLKTCERHEIEIFHLHIPGYLFVPALDQLGCNCKCDPKHLVPVPLGVWEWWQQFACVVCGTEYFCECFRAAITNFWQRADKLKSVYDESGWPHKFLRAATRRLLRNAMLSRIRGTMATIVSGSLRGCYGKNLVCQTPRSQGEVTEQ